MICRAALIGSLLVLGLAAGGGVQAQTPKERARALFREGNRLFARKMYLDALDRYRKARALFPSYKIDLNIGGTLDKMGRRTEAAVYFERFLVQSADAPAPIIASARQRLEQLRGKLARAKVTTLLTGATILVDGLAVGKVPLDTSVYLEPGHHKLEARKVGAQPSSREVTVTAGQELAVDLSPASTVEAPASAPAPAEAPASAPAEAPASAPTTVVDAEPTPSPPPPAATTPPADSGPDPDKVEQRRRKTIWAWTTLAIGGASAVTAAFLYGFGGAQVSSAYDTYSAEREPTKIEEAWGEVETAQTKVIAGHVMAGVAVVGIGISIYLFASRQTLEEPLEEPRVTLAPFGAGAALSGSF